MRSRFWSYAFATAVGVVVGMLYAPKSGKETRDDLRKAMDDLMEQGADTYEDQRERILQAVDTSRQNIVQKSEELRKKIDEAKDRVREQVDAVAESAREKINIAAEKAAGSSDEEGSSDGEATEGA